LKDGLDKDSRGWKETALWRKGDRADGPRPCRSRQWTDDGVLGDGETRMERKKEMGEAKRTGRKSSTTCQVHVICIAHCAIDGNGLRSGNALRRDRDSEFPHSSIRPTAVQNNHPINEVCLEPITVQSNYYSTTIY
jgi:hypothetical protein